MMFSEDGTPLSKKLGSPLCISAMSRSAIWKGNNTTRILRGWKRLTMVVHHLSMTPPGIPSETSSWSFSSRGSPSTFKFLSLKMDGWKDSDPFLLGPDLFSQGDLMWVSGSRYLSAKLTKNILSRWASAIAGAVKFSWNDVIMGPWK